MKVLGLVLLMMSVSCSKDDDVYGLYRDVLFSDQKILIATFNSKEKSGDGSGDFNKQSCESIRADIYEKYTAMVVNWYCIKEK